MGSIDALCEIVFINPNCVLSLLEDDGKSVVELASVSCDSKRFGAPNQKGAILQGEPKMLFDAAVGWFGSWQCDLVFCKLQLMRHKGNRDEKTHHFAVESTNTFSKNFNPRTHLVGCASAVHASAVMWVVGVDARVAEMQSPQQMLERGSFDVNLQLIPKFGDNCSTASTAPIKPKHL